MPNLNYVGFQYLRHRIGFTCFTYTASVQETDQYIRLLREMTGTATCRALEGILTDDSFRYSRIKLFFGYDMHTRLLSKPLSWSVEWYFSADTPIAARLLDSYEELVLETVQVLAGYTGSRGYRGQEIEE